MSSLIEQAALRLEQLRQAGVDVPAASMPAKPAHESHGPDTLVSRATAPDQAAVTSRQVELNFETLEAARILTPDAPRSLQADQYRVVKRPLIKNAMERGSSALTHGNLIMVTSALAG